MPKSPAATPPPEMESIFKKPAFQLGIALERQATAHIRRLIKSNVIKPGDRLPTIRELAAWWDTNYFTIQSAIKPLVSEGLLTRRPKLGTFVANQQKRLKRVCLYHGGLQGAESVDEFYNRIDLFLYQKLSQKHISTLSYFDRRSSKEQRYIPKELDDGIKGGEIDAIIALWHDIEAYGWIVNLTIPWSTPGLQPMGHTISFDFNRFCEQATQAIVEAGKKRPAFISAIDKKQNDTIGELFTGSCGSTKLLHEPEVLCVPRKIPKAQAGYEICSRLLAQKARPDAIVVDTDTVCQGVIAALTESQLRVPEDVLLISHANKEIPVFSPFSVIWLAVSIHDWADEVIEQLNRQIAGKAPRNSKLHTCVMRSE
ncbi:GntR family transcriptional regulator [Coraliomargarita parva]|uniref:GntR family transcriptional regulator n=1 Tax=Coraliomargarita parva TaxID=3014050 RepID=UPI0022B3D871|nr:GntR family transcriptional regulator [Coraliomargarita parva]